MTPLELWRQKLIQLLHDPPAKLFFLRSGAGGHEGLAFRLFDAIAGVPLRWVPRGPDRAAAGADRPVASPPSRTKGQHPIMIHWPAYPVLTHPLAASNTLPSGQRASTAIAFEKDAGNLRGMGATRALREQIVQTLSATEERRELNEEEEAGHTGEADLAARETKATEKLASLPLWSDLFRLKEACWHIWRRWPETTPEGVTEVIWRHQPADSRTPDHSLWDHVRMASALAFMRNSKVEAANMPWLLAFSVGPVKRFIAQSRTSADLWTASMLLSDLVWHAIERVIERYGPESIVYPDLRGNPRVDQWILEQQRNGRWAEVLPDGADGCSYAGIFPNTFIALIPRGASDAGALEPIESVANDARGAVRSRWEKLADLTKDYFVEEAEKLDRSFSNARPAFEETWKRQHSGGVLFTAWTAVAWPNLEPIKNVEALAIRNALPAQAPAPTLDGMDQQALSAWLDRHRAWLPTEALAAYAQARLVYARTNLTMHQLQRGFDYPLIHHALHARHAIRKAEAQGALLDGEAGDKCTLCGVRQALGNDPGLDSVDQQREAVRNFWRRFDRVSEDGKERLCAVCTMKRVLIRAGIRKEHGRLEKTALTSAWAGRTSADELIDEDNRLRVPFPSTATIAAQDYLCSVATCPNLQAKVAAVVRCCDAANLGRTTFVRALRSLAEVAQRIDASALRFLHYEAEVIAFPEVLRVWEDRAPDAASNQSSAGCRKGWLLNRNGSPISKQHIQALRKAVEDLCKAARHEHLPSPGSQIAVLAADGDGIRKLLLGTQIGAEWRDVIHPGAVEKLKQDTRGAGWPELLEKKRLMGPSIHAFTNRVLATFVHTIVPWVVEREFQGRLIYAGGDDVLAIVPAPEALDIAARLAQLYSANWVLDQRPDEEPWGWRRKSAAISSSADPAERFVVVVPDSIGRPISWPVPDEHRRSSIARPGAPTAHVNPTESLLPMMGSGQTLSVGIAVGHYKTPLGELVQAAWEERDRAKGKFANGRVVNGQSADESIRGNAFSIRRFTRGGEKATLRLAWGDAAAAPDEALEGYRRAKRVIHAFKDRTLPGSLPYKLRAVEEAVVAAWLESLAEFAANRDPHQGVMPEEYRKLVCNVKSLARGVFGVQTSGGDRQPVRDAFEIWWCGLVEAMDIFNPPSRAIEASPYRERGLGSERGLAVCRFLGALCRGEEESP